MSKKLVIDRCGDPCPMYDFNRYRKSYKCFCTLAMKDVDRIYIGSGFPKWCPLDDNKDARTIWEWKNWKIILQRRKEKK